MWPNTDQRVEYTLHVSTCIKVVWAMRVTKYTQCLLSQNPVWTLLNGVSARFGKERDQWVQLNIIKPFSCIRSPAFTSKQDNATAVHFNLLFSVYMYVYVYKCVYVYNIEIYKSKILQTIDFWKHHCYLLNLIKFTLQLCTSSVFVGIYHYLITIFFF